MVTNENIIFYLHLPKQTFAIGEVFRIKKYIKEYVFYTELNLKTDIGFEYLLKCLKSPERIQKIYITKNNTDTKYTVDKFLNLLEHCIINETKSK